VPLVTHSLQHVDASRVLLNAPNLVQVEPQDGADQDLVDNLMADEGDRLAWMAGSQLVEESDEACLHIGRALAAGKVDPAGGRAPQPIGLRERGSRLGVGQALELPVVDVQQSIVGLHGQAQCFGQGFEGLPGAEQRASVDSDDRFALEPPRDGAGLGLANLVEGQVGAAPEALGRSSAFTSTGVPGRLAVADEEDAGAIAAG
jgi:hypothetical protein